MQGRATRIFWTGIALAVCGAAADGQQQQPTLAERAVQMALTGRCNEAMPLLKQAAKESTDKDTRRLTGKFGVRCSMLLDRQGEATTFLSHLQQEFPNDPDILFLAVHMYSDLAYRNSEQLMKVAPDSAEVLRLNAENFEKTGDAKKAIGEYRVLLQKAPGTPGIHYRIGGLLLDHAGEAGSEGDARKEFEEELKIDPTNAGAEYYLGEMARRAENLPEAVEHFSRATKLAPAFAEAQFGEGRALLDSGKTAESVAPLEAATRLAPDNPTMHFALATAYQRMGRKEDAAREFGLQKSTSDKINANTKALHKNISGADDSHK
ncbi:MAG TPA: tetratricopeptide repeat protein [Bryobacteraceae bacterium]|nr:tetratricopeptide repeat protein [Bryobacteraceae bacterium]